jgi:hypothetical protein
MPAHRLTRRAALALPLLMAAAPSHAQAPAGGRVLLDVTGRLARPTGEGGARFDLAALDALPQGGFTTRTPWHDGPRRFTGVPGAALLAAVGAEGTEVVAIALNDYRVTIPVADFRDAGLIITTRVDGEPIPVRAKGPLWVVYPFDSDARLRNEVYFGRSIWQLRRLEFRG